MVIAVSTYSVLLLPLLSFSVLASEAFIIVSGPQARGLGSPRRRVEAVSPCLRAHARKLAEDGQCKCHSKRS